MLRAWILLAHKLKSARLLGGEGEIAGSLRVSLQVQHSDLTAPGEVLLLSTSQRLCRL